MDLQRTVISLQLQAAVQTHMENRNSSGMCGTYIALARIRSLVLLTFTPAVGNYNYTYLTK